MFCYSSGNKINPDFVALNHSRGIETPEHKLFMRLTGKFVVTSEFCILSFSKQILFKVLLSDLVVFYTSTILLVKKLYGSASTPLLLILLNPTLILIDHGHFQYNCVSLGLMQLAVYFIVSNASKHTAIKACILLATGSACFSLALNYKQMELYHALPFFFYLLSICISNSKDSILFRFLIILIQSHIC